MKILRSVHRHGGRQEEVEKPVYTAADYYPNVSQYCTSDEFSNIMDATAAAEAAKAAAEAAAASANKACECADRACQCAIQAEEAAHEAQQAIDTVNAAKEAAENAASSAQLSADTAQAAAEAVKDVAAQAEASADRAASEADKACACADAAKISETAAAASATKAEEVYEAFAKSAVYRGVWNPKSGTYPDAKGTNSYWDVILNEGDVSDSFDGKIWRPGDRLIYSSVENKYHHVPFPGGGAGGVVSVNGMTGAVTLTADSLNVYTKDKVYTKDETYSKLEVYDKDEVYRKEETYRRGEVYLKNETYNREETYDKEEVDALLANTGGGSGGSVKRFYKPFDSSYVGSPGKQVVRVLLTSPTFKGKLTVEISGSGLNSTDSTTIGSYMFDVDSLRTDPKIGAYPVLGSKYSSKNGELLQPLDKGYYSIVESSSGAGNASINFLVFLEEHGECMVTVTDYSGENPSEYEEVWKILVEGSGSGVEVPTTIEQRPVQTIELMDFTASGGSGGGGTTGKGIFSVAAPNAVNEARWITYKMKAKNSSGSMVFSANLRGSGLGGGSLYSNAFSIDIGGNLHSASNIKGTITLSGAKGDNQSIIHSLSGNTVSLSILLAPYSNSKLDISADSDSSYGIEEVTHEWSLTKPSGTAVSLVEVVPEQDEASTTGPTYFHFTQNANSAGAGFLLKTNVTLNDYTIFNFKVSGTGYGTGGSDWHRPFTLQIGGRPYDNKWSAYLTTGGPALTGGIPIPSVHLVGGVYQLWVPVAYFGAGYVAVDPRTGAQAGAVNTTGWTIQNSVVRPASGTRGTISVYYTNDGKTYPL